MTAIAFDFDDIRRRRNQLLGLEPNGRVFERDGTLVDEPDFSEIDQGRPLNWRINQHRAAHRAWRLIGTDLAKEGDTTAVLELATPSWLPVAVFAHKRVRFKPSGAIAIILRATSGISSASSRFENITVVWEGDFGECTYDRYVFLKNFELADRE